MKGSTMVLSNSGHDHIRSPLEKKSRNPYMVAPSALVSLVCCVEGLFGVLSMEDPLRDNASGT